MTSQWLNPDAGNQTSAAYMARIDNASAIAKRLAGAFGCYAQATENMTVVIDAGVVCVDANVTRVAAQQSVAIVAPVGSNQRYDRIVLNPFTGVVSVVTGVAGNAPSAPNVPSGNVPLAKLGPLTANTSFITDSLIDDERAPNAQVMKPTGIRRTYFPKLTAGVDFNATLNISSLPSNMVALNVYFRNLTCNNTGNMTLTYANTTESNFRSTGYNGTVMTVNGAANSVSGLTSNSVASIVNSFANTERYNGMIRISKRDSSGDLYDVKGYLGTSPVSPFPTKLQMIAETMRFITAANEPLGKVQFTITGNRTFNGGEVYYSIDTQD